MLINHIECNNVYMTLLVHKKAYRDHLLLFTLARLLFIALFVVF